MDLFIGEQGKFDYLFNIFKYEQIVKVYKVEEFNQNYDKERLR